MNIFAYRLILQIGSFIKIPVHRVKCKDFHHWLLMFFWCLKFNHINIWLKHNLIAKQQKNKNNSFLTRNYCINELICFQNIVENLKMIKKIFFTIQYNIKKWILDFMHDGKFESWLWHKHWHKLIYFIKQTLILLLILLKYHDKRFFCTISQLLKHY